MNLIPQILKAMKQRSELVSKRGVVDRKISVLTNCIDTLRFVQKVKDEHRLLKTGGKDG